LHAFARKRRSLRHGQASPHAIIVQDPEESAKFFGAAFDMKVVGKAPRGLFVSDGAVRADGRPRLIPSTRSNTAIPTARAFDLTHNGWSGAVKDGVPKA
jgi:hypothetical protein